MTRTRRTPRSTLTVMLTALWLVVAAAAPAAAISNGSTLEFLNQPKATVVDEPITNAVGSQGNPIRVAVFNGSGDRERIAGIPVKLAIANDTGTPGACLYLPPGPAPTSCPDVIAPTDADGVAQFWISIDTEGFAYALVARAMDTGSVSSGNIATDRSAPFDILETIQVSPCSPSCDDTIERSTTTATVTVAQGDGDLVLGLGGALDCSDDGYQTSSETLTFDVQGVGRTYVTMTLDSAPKPAKKYEVCFSSPESAWQDQNGAQVAPNEAALLADCGDAVGNDPCVESRRSRRGDVTVVFSVPTGDPRGVL